jgi:hypothetical protein
MPDEYSGCQLRDLRLVARHGPGEDIDLNPALGEALRNFDHIHVKAACVAGSRLLKRRCVDTDGRDPP